MTGPRGSRKQPQDAEVWVVDRHCDKITPKTRKAFDKNERFATQYSWQKTIHFETERDACQFIINRAVVALAEAEREVKCAKMRVKKCTIKYGVKSEQSHD